MLILKRIFRCTICILILSILLIGISYAGSRDLEITCPVSGSSIEVAPARAGRLWIIFWNSGSLDVRIGKITSGTPNLTISNSILLKAGINFADSPPGTFKGRWVCMSNTATASNIGISETWIP